MLTGRSVQHMSSPSSPLLTNRGRRRSRGDHAALHRGRHFAARTVYLSERHLRDVDRIVEAWQQIEPRRLSRSAVVRRAVEYLRAAVEADPAKSMLENE